MKKTNTHFLKFFCLLLGTLFWSGNAFAQDICTSATPLPVSGTCTNTLGTNTGATPSGEVAPSCGNFATGEDTWFSITVPASGSIDILASTAGGPTDWAMSLYSGACGALTEIECDDDDGPGLFPLLNITGQTPGATLFLRVWEWGNNATGDFNICAVDPAAVPPLVNDNCADATVLPVEEGTACTAQTLGTNVNATASGEAAPSCGNFATGEDSWFSITVPASGIVNIESSTAGGPTDWAMSVYSGACGALTEIECDDDDGPGLFPLINLTGQTPGDVLLLRVWEWGNNTEGEFNICAFAPAVVCDLMVDSEAFTDETCPDAEDGTITIVASTSFGPVTYNLTGPVTMSNATGSFTGLPQGTYNYTVTDDGFPAGAGPCEVMGGPITIAGDAAGPLLTCPPNSVISCDDFPIAAATAADFIAQGGTITDDCEIASVTSEDVATGDICPATAQQVITRTYTVTDESGNTSTCEQTITILNSLNGPVITSIPLDQTIDCAVNAFPQPHLFIAVGDCQGAITYNVSEASSLGTPGCPGSRISYTYTATDDCGRIAQHQQTYTLSNEGPEFVCPVDICIIQCPADNDMIQEQFDDYAGLATVINSCSESGVVISNNFNPNGFFNQNCNSGPVNGVDNVVRWQTVTFSATDQCGRRATCSALVVIQDEGGPVMTGNIPLGFADCAAANQQQGYDNWIDLALSNLSAMDECSGTPTSVSYSPLSPNTDCSGGLATTDVTFTSTDACGNETFMNAYYRIIDYGSIPMATVSGSLMTEENEAVELAEVTVDGGSFSNMMMTSVDGGYEFDLEMNQNHAITPSRNDNPLNGITSYDLIIMAQHLLEIQALDSPYKLIAADVNRSGSITILDLIELRRLILHIDEEFTNNTSWRFVDANYIFPDESNPFATTFPEAVSINNLSQAELRDFIAVKIGDLNGSASPSTLLNNAGDTRDRNELVFQVEDQQLSANQTYTVDFKAKDFNDILGYQFTLAFDPNQVEMVDFEAGALENLTADNFGNRAKQGLLTSSWNVVEAISISDDATLFSISFKANANVNMSDAIRFNSELTSAEAYSQDESLLNLGLAFNTSSSLETEFALLQNRPNPFNNETLIAFNLPEMTTATLTIYDVAGRVLKQYKGDFNKGYNEITVDRADLSGTGLLYYQLETPTDVATMKMIVQ